MIVAIGLSLSIHKCLSDIAQNVRDIPEHRMRESRKMLRVRDHRGLVGCVDLTEVEYKSADENGWLSGQSVPRSIAEGI